MHLPEVEQLELGCHSALLNQLVELADERPRVGEHVVAEVGRPHGQAAGIGLRVEDLEPLVERVVDAAAGRELDDEVGVLADRRDPLPQKRQVERRLVLPVADMDVDHRRAGTLAVLGGLRELLRRGRQVGTVFLRRLGTCRGHGDQERVGHGVIVSEGSRQARPTG